MKNLNDKEINNIANSLRFLSADMVEQANSGHPGMPMGFANAASVLFSKFLSFNPQNPKWENRDRLVLSAGHGSTLLYSFLHLAGYKNMTLDQVKNFRQFGYLTAGHPEIEQENGIEVTTGPLGQGIAMAVGLALGEKKLNALTDNETINHYTYAILGDGCLMEGISHEAFSLASHLNLNKLIVLWDDNNITIDGNVTASDSTNTIARMQAYGFNTISVDGYDNKAIEDAIKEAKESDKPSFIAVKTKIGYGSPNKQNTSSVHGSPLGKEELKLAKKNLDYNYDSFEIPSHIKELWQEISNANIEKYKSWEQKADLKALENIKNHDFYNKELENSLQNLVKTALQENKADASRNTMNKVLDKLVTSNKELVLGGCADLAASVKTKTSINEDLTKDNYKGNHLAYGIREHAMGAVMNGLASYSNILPYGGTFLIFAEYMKQSIRLSALMERHVLYILSHDSIGVGEDGPTHQPVEQLAGLNLVPNLNVFRPCDIVECAESLLASLHTTKTPSAFVTSRQNLDLIRDDFSTNIEANKTYKGAYVVLDNNAKVDLIASGSEVTLAKNVLNLLEKEHGIKANLISMPCYDLFVKQSNDYKNSVIKKDNLSVLIQASHSDLYRHLLSINQLVFDIKEFGVSGKAEDVFEHFGFNASKIALKIKQALQ